MDPTSLEVYEDCVGLYATDKTDADTITKVIIDSLTRFNLPLNHCRGQCYDGASTMSGKHTGVCTQKERAQGYVHSLYGS